MKIPTVHGHLHPEETGSRSGKKNPAATPRALVFMTIYFQDPPGYSPSFPSVLRLSQGGEYPFFFMRQKLTMDDSQNNRRHSGDLERRNRFS
jgi:hypothetical protein